MHGTVSFYMAILLRRRSETLRELNQLVEARAAVLESLRISELVSGRGDDYATGLSLLADICRREGDFDAGLRHVQKARSLISAENLRLLGAILNLEAHLLMKLGRYQEALLVREKALDVTLRVNGPNHPEYATGCLNAADLYAELKQTQPAIDLGTKALAIFMKTFGPLHPLTRTAQKNLARYRKALTDPEVSKMLVTSKNRMCNIEGCNTVEESMERCLACKAHYLCKKHTKRINKHVSLCPKFGDLLPDEKKGAKIVKCRRCRKEVKLMKCAVCESVWYCGAQCQKEDWKRHKVFCGKK